MGIPELWWEGKALVGLGGNGGELRAWLEIGSDVP